MNRLSRRAIVVVSCAVVGVIAAGTLTAAYAAGSNRGGDALHGCVSTRTGMLRVVDPQRGGRCVARGPFQEYAITLSQAAGLPGPVGPRGPRGPAGDGIESLDALEGRPCNVDSEDEGEVVIRILPPEQGSVVQMVCETDETVTYSPPPPIAASPTTTRPPVTTTRPPIDEGTPDPTTTSPPTSSQPTTTTVPTRTTSS
ncbi:hypothetical protein [Pseudonocardia abyssalis]|uniref:Uncharacterized protein n=1 Tax=Pseudonocardia abyssalis TaxID=2792008 RepID=A0ABS6UX85_9PSEU|nr:hypothetical protein [Pseudonocardia abyssalis]MBW0118683.1 hypothetical protein [Pseudonocardia abyssalis]MBW0136830.1 hypothetical protein [Pseudonocardia abyssalis]